MSLIFRSVAFTSTSLLLFGCISAQTEESNIAVGHGEAALTIQQNTERALRGVIDSVGHLATSQTLASTLSLLGGTTTTCTSSAVSAPCATGSTNCDAVGSEPACTVEENDVSLADLAKVRTDALEATDKLIARLRDEVFTEANLESDDGKTSVYRLDASLFCSENRPVVTAGTAPATAPTATLDPECAANVARLAPKLRIVSPRAGDIDVTLTLTDKQISPLTLNVYQNRLGAHVDLAAIQSASDASGVPMEGVSRLTGKLEAELIENGTLDYSFTLSVPEMIRAVLGDKPQKFTATLAASPNALGLRFDGNSREIEGRIDIASFNLTAALGAFFNDDQSIDDTGALTTPKPYTGNITGYLAGLQGNVSYVGATDRFALTDIGYGGQPAYVKYDESTLLSLDVNAGASRRFDVTLDRDANGAPNLEYSPGLDINVLLGFSAIANQVSDIEPFLLNDSVRFALTGEKPRVALSREQLKVVSGTLEIRSLTNSSYGATATAGMCLVEARTENPKPSYAALFAAEACQ